MNVEHAKELSDRLRRGNLPREHSIAHLRHASAHNGILKEEVVQVLVNHAVHPVEELALAAFFQTPLSVVFSRKMRMTSQSSASPVFSIAEAR